MIKEIDILVAFIKTVPYDSHRYLWATRLIKDLNFPNGKYLPENEKKLNHIRPIPVVHLGNVYPSISSASKILGINESNLRHDILIKKFFYQVYILK